jgi:hypothetical protein
MDRIVRLCSVLVVPTSWNVGFWLDAAGKEDDDAPAEELVVRDGVFVCGRVYEYILKVLSVEQLARRGREGLKATCQAGSAWPGSSVMSCRAGMSAESACCLVCGREAVISNKRDEWMGAVIFG